MVMAKPDQGWRSRYGGRGTEEFDPKEIESTRRRRNAVNVAAATLGRTGPVPDATGLELIAQELRERDADSVLDTEFFREKAAITVTAGSIRETLECLRDKGFNFLASVHGVDYFPEEPRLGVHYELLDMTEVDRLTVKVRVPLDEPHVPSVTADVADRRPSGARGLRHVRRDLRRSPGPAPHPDARGLRGPPAAPRLPDGRRGDPLHAQRAEQPGLVEQ